MFCVIFTFIISVLCCCCCRCFSFFVVVAALPSFQRIWNSFSLSTAIWLRIHSFIFPSVKSRLASAFFLLPSLTFHFHFYFRSMFKISLWQQSPLKMLNNSLGKAKFIYIRCLVSDALARWPVCFHAVWPFTPLLWLFSCRPMVSQQMFHPGKSFNFIIWVGWHAHSFRYIGHSMS